MVKVIVIIPARGGSKRIPKKNIINFYDKPMIAWTIEAAIKSGITFNSSTDIVVSTDDEEIAQVSKDFGANVPFLRDKHNDDHSTISQATIYTLEEIEKRTNKKYDIVVQLMANCPIRNQVDIRNAYENFINNDSNFQISCFKFGWMNPWWACKLNDKSSPEFIFPEALKKRSQDLDDLYCPTGAIWIANVKDLKKEKTFYGKSLTFFPIDWTSAVDIDDYKDLEMAKSIFNLQN
ncbi:MAG: acylneuraminate cytidylyltransferase family protein [bacterium]